MPASEKQQADDLPDARQLERLSSSLLLFAQRHNKLSIKIDQKRHVKRYHVGSIVEYERPDIFEGAPFGYLYRRSIGAMATQVAYRQWSLRIFSRNEVTDMGSDVGGLRTTYLFDWKNGSTEKSGRIIAPTPAPEPRDMHDLIDNFRMNDDDAVAVELDTVMASMTAADVEMLRSDIKLITEPIDQRIKPYFERQLNYMDYYEK